MSYFGKLQKCDCVPKRCTGIDYFFKKKGNSHEVPVIFKATMQFLKFCQFLRKLERENSMAKFTKWKIIAVTS